MKISYVNALIFSGIIWLIVGFSLAFKGVNYALSASGATVGSFSGPMLAMILSGVILGYLKGRFILSKTVKKYVQYIVQFDEPLKITQLFPKRYLLVVGIMMVLGMSMKVLPIPFAAKSVIDFTVGVALFYGASLYFGVARTFSKELPKED